jgi:cyclomaltodextrinase / maltogenic alpha-amylase / neopullulanase
VGLSQHQDVMQNGRAIHEETRLPMLWGEEQNRDLFAFYKELIHLRASRQALRYGARQNIFADEKVFAYRRSKGNNSLIIALNLSERKQTIELPLTDPVILFTTGPGFAIQIEGGRKEIVLPPYGGAVLQ